jgi:hypothetical protein
MSRNTYETMNLEMAILEALEHEEGLALALQTISDRAPIG